MSKTTFKVGDIVDFKVPHPNSFTVTAIKGSKLLLDGSIPVDQKDIVLLDTDHPEVVQFTEVGNPLPKLDLGQIVPTYNGCFGAEIVLRVYDYKEKTWKYLYRFDDESLCGLDDEYSLLRASEETVFV